MSINSLSARTVEPAAGIQALITNSKTADHASVPDRIRVRFQQKLWLDNGLFGTR